MNKNDSERLGSVLEQIGLQPTSDVHTANVVVLNSCSVRQTAEDRIYGTVRELDLIQVKGKNEPVKVWELMGMSDMTMTPKEKESLEVYQQGLELYRKRNWQEAIGYMNQAIQLDPTCHVTEIYTQRAGLYQLNPPPDDWNGVFVMTTK